MPKSRTEFWKAKFAANVVRDHRHALALEAAGWRIVTIWECETRRSDMLARAIASVGTPVADGEAAPPTWPERADGEDR